MLSKPTECNVTVLPERQHHVLDTRVSAVLYRRAQNGLGEPNKRFDGFDAVVVTSNHHLVWISASRYIRQYDIKYDVSKEAGFICAHRSTCTQVLSSVWLRRNATEQTAGITSECVLGSGEGRRLWLHVMDLCFTPLGQILVATKHPVHEGSMIQMLNAESGDELWFSRFEPNLVESEWAPALAALHFSQRCQQLLEHVARQMTFDASDAAAEEVCAKKRLREEWRRRKHWVQQQAVERRGPKKGRNKQTMPTKCCCSWGCARTLQTTLLIARTS